MKKKSLIIAVSAILALCFCLGACGSNDSADTCDADATATEATAEESLDEYAGKTFTGTSPWEEDMSITIGNVDGNQVDMTYCENANGKPLINEEIPANEVTDNVATLSFSNSGDEDTNGYEMNGTVEFSDGQLIVTFISGCKTENSSEGGSSYHNVDALDDDQKVVVLTCE